VIQAIVFSFTLAQFGQWETQMTIDSAATTIVLQPGGSWPVPKPDKAADTARAAQSTQAQDSAADAPPTAESLRAVVKQIESFLKGNERSLSFSVDETTGRTVISVRDAASGDLIRQIPGEDALRIARALANGAKSLYEIVA
jgi:flagellar protein FlaG